MPAQPAPARLFLALWPGPRMRRALAACRDSLPWPSGTVPTPTDKLHLTLHFIGGVPPQRLPELVAGLAAPVQPIELQLSLLDSWRGGVTVLRPASVPEQLLHLHADLATALHRLALPVEPRPYRPHVTLARHGPGLPPATIAAPRAALRWRPTGYALVRSMADGRYHVLARWA